MKKSGHESMKLNEHYQVIDSDVACSSPKGVQKKKLRVVVSSIKRKSDGGRL